MDELRGMTVRELIVALSQVEDEIRAARRSAIDQTPALAGVGAEVAGAVAVDELPESGVDDRTIELSIREQQIVDELRGRRETEQLG